MSGFACAIRGDRGGIPVSFRLKIANARFFRSKQLEWYTAHGLLGAIALDGAGLRATVARVGRAIGIGAARLDNRSDVMAWVARRDDSVSDLELLTRFVLSGHGAHLERLLGDFAVVVWDPTTQQLMAARDALGVGKLYYSHSQGVYTFSSRAEPLASGDLYDVQYLVDRITQCSSGLARTAYADVNEVPPATLLRAMSGAPNLTSYWSASDAQAASNASGSIEEQVDAFRALLTEAVRLRLDSHDTWSQLSGGLDSSSVVSIAQSLARAGIVPHGLAGTVTYTDTLGTGADEKEYSDAVVQQFCLRNELVPHRLTSTDTAHDLPWLDQPNRSFRVAVRDRAATQVIQEACGRVLLTGEGGDGLVAGTMFFFADWLARGNVRRAFQEMAHRAALGRVSFWALAYKNAVLPLLPAPVRCALGRHGGDSVVPWVPSAMSRRFQLASRIARNSAYGGRIGRKYSDAVATTIAGIPSSMPLGPLDDELDVRHPYLYRPLVELALRFTPEMCVRPHQRKWVLREAMRGILPELVRTRVGKGSLDGLNSWSLINEERRLDRLLRDPILAQLGCIDLPSFRRALEGVLGGREGYGTWRDRVNCTLEVEMWLQLRSGRWAAERSQSTALRGEVVSATGQRAPDFGPGERH